VINEQERMLEERRVGLISQEEVIKELRAEKEKNLKSLAQVKAERDEATRSQSRLTAHTQALEDENKRLGRLLVEAQSKDSGGGDHLLRVTNDLKEIRIEARKIEADRDRLQELYDRTERDREKAEGRLHQLEVELQEAVLARAAADSARGVAQDALAKAEVARHKLEEEAIAAARAKDEKQTGESADKREIEKLRKQVGALEGKLKSAVAGDPAAGAAERELTERKLKELADKAGAAERAMKALQAELDAAKTDAQKARAEAARARAASEQNAEDLAPPGAANGALAAKAREVYEAINDILSDMRNNVVLVQGELTELKGNADTLRAVRDAVDALVDSAETAKGALRGLRELGDG
jgi:chromosome segregation ATPase